MDQILYPKVKFVNGVDYVHEEKHSGRPTVITNDSTENVDEKIQENR